MSHGIAAMSQHLECEPCEDCSKALELPIETMREFIQKIARLTKDQECKNCRSSDDENTACASHELWDMPNDDAVETLNGLITEARFMWKDLPVKMSAEDSNSELIAAGYRRISNRYGLIARIDRHDWQSVIIQTTHQTSRSMRKSTPGTWEDHYRRLHSKDRIELGSYRGRKIPQSHADPTGYIPL